MINNEKVAMVVAGSIIALGLGGMVTKIVKQTKECVNIIKNVNTKLDNGINIKTAFGYDGYYHENIGFVVSDELLAAYGLFGCGAITIGFGRIVIAMSSRLFNLVDADDIKKAMVYHEIGHILNRDLADSKEAAKRSFERNFKTPSKDNAATKAELMADRFVADTIGIKAAYDMLRILEVEFDDFCHQKNTIAVKSAKKKMDLEFRIRRDAILDYENHDYEGERYYQDLHNHYYYADADYCRYFA